MNVISNSRSPILYGPVQYVEESAVTTLIKAAKDKEGKPVVSDYEVHLRVSKFLLFSFLNKCAKYF